MKKKVLALFLASMLAVPSVSSAVMAEDALAAVAEAVEEAIEEAEEAVDEAAAEAEEAVDEAVADVEEAIEEAVADVESAVGNGLADALNPYDLTLVIGSNSYTLPMSLAQCEEAGLNVPEVSLSSEGASVTTVPVDNGRSAFRLIFKLIDDEPWAVGYEVETSKVPNAEIAGINWTGLTKAEILNTFGSRIDFADAYVSDTLISVEIFKDMYEVDLWFESEAEDAVIESIEVMNRIPQRFGTAFDELPAASEDLPDVTSMPFDSFILNGQYYDKNSTVQDLLDNGWVLNREYNTPEDEVEKYYGFSGYIYNGSGLAYVSAHNYTDETATIAECQIDGIDVDILDNSELILTDGLTFGSSLEDFEATLGSASSSEEGDFGSTSYTFDVLNGVEYYAIFLDNEAVSLAVDDLN